MLVVEDETSISEPLAEHLSREGFETRVASSLVEATEAFEDAEPDFLLLDVMLPDGDGRDLCRAAAAPTCRSSCSARGEEVDRIVGLELGADDYVVKPFSAGARRSHASDHAPWTGWRRSRPQGAITIGAISLDPAARIVTKGLHVDLATKEFDLLRLLMSRAGEVVPREEIMDEVWDPHWFGPTKTLDVHISWLRKKLEDDPSNPRYITTTRRRVPLRLTEGRLKERSPRRSERVSSWPSPTCSSR